jgi:hypothetical protein
MPNQPDTCHCRRLPRVLYGPATCHRTNLPRVLYGPATCPVRTVRIGTVSIQNFACLAWRTKCDIFSIRTPFDKVNIPLGIRKTRQTQWCWFHRIPSTFIFEHFSCPDRLLNPISDQLIRQNNPQLHAKTPYNSNLHEKT